MQGSELEIYPRVDRHMCRVYDDDDEVSALEAPVRAASCCTRTFGCLLAVLKGRYGERDCAQLGVGRPWLLLRHLHSSAGLQRHCITPQAAQELSAKSTVSPRFLQIIPDVTGWEFSGEEEVRGQKANVWVFTERCALLPAGNIHGPERPGQGMSVTARRGLCIHVFCSAEQRAPIMKQ